MLKVGDKLRNKLILEIDGRSIKVKCECGFEYWIKKYSKYRKYKEKCVSCSSQGSIVEIKGPRKYSIEGSKIRILYRNYIRKSQERGKYFELSLEEFSSLVFKNCKYCNSEPSNSYKVFSTNYSKQNQLDGVIKYNGIDRIDNSIGYIYSNCVPCCKACNSAKGEMTLEQFKAWANNLHTHINA